MADARLNFSTSFVSTVVSGSSIIVQSGQGTRFPAPPFNAIVAPEKEEPTSENSEVIRVTAVVGDTFTISRKQEGSTERSIVSGDRIYAGPTAKTFADIEALVSSGGVTLPLTNAPENCVGANVADRAALLVENIKATSGTMYGVRVPVLPASKIKAINLMSGSTASVTLTHSWGALYDTAWKKIGVSPDNTALWGGKTLRTFTLETEYTVPGGVKAVYAFLCVVAATVPTMSGVAALSASMAAVLPWIALEGSSGLTDQTTAPTTTAHVAGATLQPYVWLT